jgi:hypothetical protein
LGGRVSGTIIGAGLSPVEDDDDIAVGTGEDVLKQRINFK